MVVVVVGTVAVVRIRVRHIAVVVEVVDRTIRARINRIPGVAPYNIPRLEAFPSRRYK